MNSLAKVATVGLAIAVLWMRATAQEVPLPPVPHSEPCVGFLLPNISGPVTKQQMGLGDVFVDCWGHTIQLTKTGDISSWALDVHNQKLLFIRAVRQGNQAAELVVQNLKPWNQERSLGVNSRAFLIASCGIVMLTNPLASSNKIVNALSALVVNLPPDAIDIRCDEDRRIIARLKKATSVEGGPLLLGTNTLGKSVAEFDVSPNGRFLAFNEDDSLCIYDMGKDSKSCTPDFKHVGRISVWDDGNAVAGAQTSQACPISQRLLVVPGSTMWPCPALFSWRSGAKESLIQFLATNPQMLPVSIGKMLLDLNE
jgi:hypothetical protein